MFCTKCGSNVDNDENFCTKCGNPTRKKENEIPVPEYEMPRQAAESEDETVILQKNAENQEQNGYQGYTPNAASEYSANANTNTYTNAYTNTNTNTNTYSNTYDNTYTDESNGAAVASLILGIISLACMLGVAVPIFPFFGSLCGLIGIILGASGRKKQAKRGMATAGLVCSIIGLVFTAVILVGCVGCVGCMALGSL